MTGRTTFATMLIDHYAVLGIPPSASVDEIKSAYRKMARQHHPDINPDDPAAPDRFRAIHNAYQTLTQPNLRQAYLEKRWYAQHQRQSMQTQAVGFEQLLKQFLELERFVATLDPHRMDRAGLHQHLLQLIECLTQVNLDPTTQEQEIKLTIQLTIASAQHLSYIQAIIVHEQLNQWLRTWNCTDWLNTDWLMKKKSQESWQRWTPWIILTLTLLLSVWIWKSAR